MSLHNKLLLFSFFSSKSPHQEMKASVTKILKRHKEKIWYMIEGCVPRAAWLTCLRLLQSKGQRFTLYWITVNVLEIVNLWLMSYETVIKMQDVLTSYSLNGSFVSVFRGRCDGVDNAWKMLRSWELFMNPRRWRFHLYGRISLYIDLKLKW